MENETKEYAFVIDSKGERLSPTLRNRAWYLIRKGRAILKNRYPMLIQLLKAVDREDADKSKIICGIDDGSRHVGIALVQKCGTKNKVLFKGTMEQRDDVKHLMDVRRGHRRYHRYHKHYRKARFDNRKGSKRKGRFPPSILQKRQAVVRVVRQLLKWTRIDGFHLEDVRIDMKALSLGYKPYKWQYQEPGRLDENMRLAVLMRDDFTCQECGKKDGRLEVHHIRPKRCHGADSIKNLITLCPKCHDMTEGREELYERRYLAIIGGKILRFDYPMHVMQGKAWLREELSKLGALALTTGGDTANLRIDWSIEKSHSNDACVITGLKPDDVDVKEWMIKPMRRKSKAKTDSVSGIKHRDIVSYTYRNGETYTGYVTALYPELYALNFQSRTKHCKKVNARKCRLLWRYDKIYWLDKTVFV